MMLLVKFTNNAPCSNFFKSQFGEFSFETDFEFFQCQDPQYLKINGTGESHCVGCR